VTHVLVHGAWHGPWCWDAVKAELNNREVVTVQLPSVGGRSVGMYDDARILRETVARIDGPVVVTAHSYGGVVATEALSGLGNIAHIV
jgi:pimeloyl-ACP methyl ester carboxylesterase